MDMQTSRMLREKAQLIRKMTIREIGELSAGHIGG